MITNKNLEITGILTLFPLKLHNGHHLQPLMESLRYKLQITNPRIQEPKLTNVLPAKPQLPLHFYQPSSIFASNHSHLAIWPLTHFFVNCSFWGRFNHSFLFSYWFPSSCNQSWWCLDVLSVNASRCFFWHLCTKLSNDFSSKKLRGKDLWSNIRYRMIERYIIKLQAPGPHFLTWI